MLLRFLKSLWRPRRADAPAPAANPEAPTGVRAIRRYRGYEDYVRHQSAKLATLDLSAYDPEFEVVLAARLADLEVVRPGASVLCLGARSGAECRAFSARGCFAVGLDLNPGADNRWVLPGDFHHLQFADGCVDLVYCNALDHALELEVVLGEVRRVLKPEGRFIAEIALGSLDAGGRGPGDYESTWWKRAQDVIDAITQQGFAAGPVCAFRFPWNGTRAVFTRVPRPAAPGTRSQ